MTGVETGLRISGGAIALNIVLALVKIVTGVMGNSYALIADGIESTTDIFASLVVWGGLRISSRPPDETHPYGHGKAESLAGMLVALFLLAAAVLIAVQSVREILTPHHVPAWYTLLVLLLVIAVKEWLFRRMFAVGEDLSSSALKSDAWHHRSDALTSLATLIGIAVALLGGEGYQDADDWAALLACGVIFYNGVRLLRPALNEVMDGAVAGDVEAHIRSLAASVEGVLLVEKCRARKSGLGLLVDLHVVVDGQITVSEGHQIAHRVADALRSADLKIMDVSVHVEPDVYVI